MKRWLVKNKDGMELKLFYSTLEDCKNRNPNSVIEECFDYEYLKLVDKIKSKSVMSKVDYRGRNIYKLNIPTGVVLFRILEQDGLILDCIQYQIWNRERFISPITWVMCDIKEFYNIFIGLEDMIFKVHTFRKYGQPKMKKPKELNKINVAFSCDFIPKKCKCQCYIKDNDLWIKHRDFFSEDMKYEKCDFGTPLEYRCKKYLDKDKSNKFIYPDAWGSITCRNEAWIVFENIIDKGEFLDNEVLLSREMLKIFSKYHKVDNTYFANGDWDFFFERVAKEILMLKNKRY